MRRPITRFTASASRAPISHHAASERYVIARLDNQVRVISLQRIVHEAERGALCAGGERALDGAQDWLRTKRHEIRRQSQRDVGGQERREAVA
jgi:hypothetical protein